MPSEPDDHDKDDYAEMVLEVVERIPPGRVMSYGDVAEYLERGGPRQVGRVMSACGGGVPWWRVLRADGTPPPGHALIALQHYRDEGTPLRPGGARVDMRKARWEVGILPALQGRGFPAEAGWFTVHSPGQRLEGSPRCHPMPWGGTA